MIIKSRAKINISLDVLNKMPDGYHSVEMIMQTLELSDTITIDRCENGIHLSTNKDFLPNDARNIAFKAAEAFFKLTGIKSGVSIHIDKFIPVSGGLAGGSGNAAAVLIAMNDIFDTKLSSDELLALGAKIGSDVPFCIMGGTALATGRGEILKPLKPIPKLYVLLAKPYFNVSTPWVYGRLKLNLIRRRPDTKSVVDAINNGDVLKMTEGMYNVLENVTAGRYRQIKDIENIMRANKALISMMSGSGPTVFGLFNSQSLAKECAEKLKNKQADIFVTKTFNV